MSHIIELNIENVKRLKAVRIAPKSNTVLITGKNDQGKTSVLDSIDWVFRGKEICDEPIRQGEKRATTSLTLSEELNGVCTIRRVYNPSGSTLEIRNAEGVPQKSPQALLDAVISKMAFDPLSFVRMKMAEQVELMRKLAGLDFTDLNKTRADAYSERTIRNRELESAKVKLAGLQFNPNLPKEPITVAALAEKLGELRSGNQANQAKRDALNQHVDNLKSLTSDIEVIKGEIADLRAQIETKKVQLTAKESAHATAQTEASTMATAIKNLEDADETGIRKQITDIEETNAAIEANRQYLAAKENLELLEGTVKGLTAKIEECDADKAAQIEFAEFPMPGLSFDETRGVLLNGVPFAQGSQAKQLLAAIAIGLALNPQVRVILIRDASLLDDHSLKAAADLAAASKAQLWMEIVNSKDPAAVVIEDGEVVK